MKRMAEFCPILIIIVEGLQFPIEEIQRVRLPVLLVNRSASEEISAYLALLSSKQSNIHVYSAPKLINSSYGRDLSMSLLEAKKLGYSHAVTLGQFRTLPYKDIEDLLDVAQQHPSMPVLRNETDPRRVWPLDEINEFILLKKPGIGFEILSARYLATECFQIKNFSSTQSKIPFLEMLFGKIIGFFS